MNNPFFYNEILHFPNKFVWNKKSRVVVDNPRMMRLETLFRPIAGYPNYPP